MSVDRAWDARLLQGHFDAGATVDVDAALSGLPPYTGDRGLCGAVAAQLPWVR